jgi:hypothetical protein
MRKITACGAGWALALMAITGAEAAPRTMISDYTGLDCSTNAAATAYEHPNDANGVDVIADQTEVHIFGGKQFGKFVAIPNTDAEFARTWLQVARVQADGKPSKKRYWIQSGLVNCGG